jgi:hypothetical protein
MSLRMHNINSAQQKDRHSSATTLTAMQEKCFNVCFDAGCSAWDAQRAEVLIRWLRPDFAAS